jgi:hypothetical protein
VTFAILAKAEALTGTQGLAPADDERDGTDDSAPASPLFERGWTSYEPGRT